VIARIVKYVRAYKGLLAYSFLAGMVAFVFYLDGSHQKDDEAKICIASHEAREHVRDSVTVSINGSANAILDVVVREGTPLTPQQMEYKKHVAEVVERARETIPNPACSLSAARRTLNHN
jgi:hypothetical protein